MVTPLAPAPAPHLGAGAPPDPAAANHGRPSAHQVLRAPISARTWREYVYLLVGSVLGALAFGTLATLVWLSIVTSWLLVGVLLFALHAPRRPTVGRSARALAAGLLDECVPDASPPAPQARRPGLAGCGVRRRRRLAGGRLRPRVDPGHGRRRLPARPAVGHLRHVDDVPDLVGRRSAPRTSTPPASIRQSGMQIGEFYFDTWPSGASPCPLAGIALLFVLPWVAHAVATADRLLVRGLLGPTRTADRVDDLEVTRAQAVDQSAATLRRIERDLHDGTQARLVALAMHLDMARERLANLPSVPEPGSGDAPGDDAATEVIDPTLVAEPPTLPDPAELERARELLERAHRDAIDAIAELREVTRSIHPPALDRGLGDALATLAARSGVPTELEVRIVSRPSPAIETIAYYCAAELLTNVAKHAGATRAAVAVTAETGVLRVQVSDDGRGGAHLAEGGGLAGLAERVGTVDGHLMLSSPAGGPTVAAVELPLAAG